MALRSVAAATGALTVLLALPVESATAQTKNQQGTSMSLAAATGPEAFGCETRFLPDIAPPFLYVKQPTGVTSCTAWQPGTTIDNTHLVPGPGTVTTVRVKSGPNPAPLRVTIVKRLFQTHPVTGQITDAICCTGTGVESATFQPTPNAVTEVPVNLKVTTTPSTNGASGHHDIVAISGVGPGDLPITSTGEHSLNAGVLSTTPTMQIFYPKVETGLQGQAQHDYANYVVLMNYDWVADSTGGGQTPQTPPTTSTPQPPPTPATPVPAAVTSKSLKLKKGKVAVNVTCTAAGGQFCQGTIRLLTRAKKPVELAKKAVNIRGGKSSTVSLKLGSKALKRVKKKTNRVTVEINLGGGGTRTANLNLNR